MDYVIITLVIVWTFFIPRAAETLYSVAVESKVPHGSAANWVTAFVGLIWPIVFAIGFVSLIREKIKKSNGNS